MAYTIKEIFENSARKAEQGQSLTKNEEFLYKLYLASKVTNRETAEEVAERVEQMANDDISREPQTAQEFIAQHSTIGKTRNVFEQGN